MSMDLTPEAPHVADTIVHELDIFKFYEKCLIPLTPSAAVTKILQVVMTGGETTEDFAQILAMDAELQHWIRLTVQRLGFEKRASKLAQAIILLGQNRVRDLIIGRHIERSFVKPGDTLLAKLTAERDKARAGKEPAPPKPAAVPPPAAAPGQKSAPTPAAEVESEPIPAIADFNRYLGFAARAEDVAISIRNSYPGQAFAGGVIFDYVNYYLKSQDLTKLTETALKNVGNYLEEIFKDGIRAGIAANEIIQKISIPHQKNVFVTSLVHNIGKTLLMAYNPEIFQTTFMASTGSKDAKVKIDSDEAETQYFNFDHAQAGSLYVGRLPFLVEIERSIDYHHSPHLLKFSNPKLYALACVLRVSGGLAKLYQKARAEDPDTEKMKDQRLTGSEDFKFLKLNPADWSDIKSNYALKLMKVGY